MVQGSTLDGLRDGRVGRKEMVLYNVCSVCVTRLALGGGAEEVHEFLMCGNNCGTGEKWACDLIPRRGVEQAVLSWVVFFFLFFPDTLFAARVFCFDVTKKPFGPFGLLHR